MLNSEKHTQKYVRHANILTADSTEDSRKAEKKHDLAKVLASGDERGFMKIMREIGLKDDAPEFLKALKAFREQVGRRSKQLS